MYADDTVLYTSKQISTLVKTLNDGLSNVNKWLIENKLRDVEWIHGLLLFPLVLGKM